MCPLHDSREKRNHDVEVLNARRASEIAQVTEAVGSAGMDDVQMDIENAEEAEEARARKRREDEERARELERAKQIQAKSLDASGSIKIRTDYVPKREFSRILWMISRALIYTFPSRCKGGEGEYDDLRSLWSTSARGRTSGTHAH